ncbi:hypothetical protein BgiBS90_004684 [Biomphalaria glabrata]|uniref:Uncharacterized protein n=1 Tax=Biomphalaria glabrata TaxID=6526 RepID=A0A2C9KKG4_BIOGL|nr:hypothetical protein BgiBS90_004684 [Biomphalaria glabrata]
MNLDWPAGVPTNEAVLLELRRRQTDPLVETVDKPTFPLGVERRPDTLLHFGWNPVYWSDYPLQPMWTVALPKIPAPVLSRQLPPFPELPSYYPPTEWMSLRSCPNWMPNLPQRTFHWNPYVSDTNTNFRDLHGPPTFKCQ